MPMLLCCPRDEMLLCSAQGLLSLPELQAVDACVDTWPRCRRLIATGSETAEMEGHRL